jgi:hypothetical protein
VSLVLPVPAVFALVPAAALCSAVVLLVCELEAGMPVLVPVLVVPACAVVVLGAVEEAVVLLASPVADGVVEADALGVVALPAVADGPDDAEVPGAGALVLPAVEAVPVCADAPAAVVVLPGAVADVLGVVDAAVDPLTSAGVAELLLGAALEADDEVLSLMLAEPEAQLPIARTLWPTCAVRSSLLCSCTALPAPVWSQNWPFFSSTQPVSFTSLPATSLPAAPDFCFLLLSLVVLSVAADDCVDVVEGVEACGVFLVSSVRVEPDVLLVELCANIVTEKHNAAAVVSSFFM